MPRDPNSNTWLSFQIADGSLQSGLVDHAGRRELAHEFFGRELQVGPVKSQEVEHCGEGLIHLRALSRQLRAVFRGTPLDCGSIQFQVPLRPDRFANFLDIEAFGG